MKIKHINKLIFFILILYNCKSVKDNIIENNNLIIEKDAEFSFNGFNYETVIDSKNDSSINNLKYNLNFLITNKNNNFTASINIFDDNNNLLLSKDNLKPASTDNKYEYVISESFITKLSYNKLKYNIKININNNIKEFSSDYINTNFPELKSLNAGPIISEFSNGNVNVNLNLNLNISNCNSLSWIKLIPPSEDSFWNIPFKIENNTVNADALIYEKNKNYIDNGKYILQINFDKYGILQKEIKITDIFNNEKGFNYGIPIAVLFADDKDKLKLGIDQMDKIDYMEIRLFTKENSNLNELCSAAYSPAQKIINKKELMNKFIDISNKEIKIKYNKEYYCKIYLYSKTFNNLNYISISEEFKIKFYGFSFPF